MSKIHFNFIFDDNLRFESMLGSIHSIDNNLGYGNFYLRLALTDCFNHCEINNQNYYFNSNNSNKFPFPQNL